MFFESDLRQDNSICSTVFLIYKGRQVTYSCFFRVDIVFSGSHRCILRDALRNYERFQTRMAPFLSAFRWLVSNWGNILAGIVAPVIVLALQTLTRPLSIALAAWLTLKWRIRLLWSLKKPTRIYVVSGACGTSGKPGVPSSR